MDAYKIPDAIILCGGLGTRLKSVQPDLPKVLTPIGDLALIDILISQLTKAGINRIILSLGYRSETVIDYVANIENPNFDIITVTETQPLGTGGALKLACSKSQSECFLVINGDSYTDINPSDLLEFHVKSESFVTMLLVRVEDSTQYGSVVVDSSGLIKSFNEKSKIENSEGLVNAGMYVINRSVLEQIKENETVSLERDIFPGLIGDGFNGYISDSKFIDIGTPETFFAAEQFFSTVKS